MAVAAITLVLALSHRLLVKDRLTRAGTWCTATNCVGTGLHGRTLGVLGLGNIGQEVMRLIEPFEMRRIASDPAVAPGVSTALGVELVDLETLLVESDFLVVLCPLTPATHGLIDARMIARMKPTACLVNVSRGPIVDQVALTDALRDGRIQGAGLDVFEHEPVATGDPLLALDNVIVTPHSLGATDQWFRGCGESAIRSILAVAAGELPDHIVNPAVLGDAQLRTKLARHRPDAHQPGL
jgi:D-3-phosphoglycerate dehydrogenase